MMFLHNVNQCFQQVGITPQSIDITAVTGAAIDMITTDGKVVLYAQCGTLTGAFVYQVYESATSGGTYTAVPSASASFAATDDDTVKAVSFDRSLRWLKTRAAPTGNVQTVASAIIQSQYKTT